MQQSRSQGINMKLTVQIKILVGVSAIPSVHLACSYLESSIKYKVIIIL
jgi:hypothetical protein